MPSLSNDRPAFVQFELRSVEDRAASIAQGHYVGRDVEFAVITPPGSGNLVVEREVTPDIIERYRPAYEAWKRKQEPPVNGTSIRDAPFLSPSQIKMLLDMHVLAIEDLATAPETLLQAIGMGARTLQQKALTYLENARDGGRVAEEVAALHVKHAALTEDLAQRDARIAQLERSLAEFTPKQEPERAGRKSA